jgi:hypothetical protein
MHLMCVAPRRPIREVNTNRNMAKAKKRKAAKKPAKKAGAKKRKTAAKKKR